MSEGYSLVVVHGLLKTVTSLVVELRLKGLGSVIAAQSLSCPPQHVESPRPGIKLMPPALATGPPGKSQMILIFPEL